MNIYILVCIIVFVIIVIITTVTILIINSTRNNKFYEILYENLSEKDKDKLKMCVDCINSNTNSSLHKIYVENINICSGEKNCKILYDLCKSIFSSDSGCLEICKDTKLSDINNTDCELEKLNTEFDKTYCDNIC